MLRTAKLARVTARLSGGGSAKTGRPPATASGRDPLLEWVKVLVPVLVSWPALALVAMLSFKQPITNLIERFSQTADGRAELGPIKIQMGAPVLPPQHRPGNPEAIQERIDLSADIGPIGDTGPEGTTVGFGLAYAIQAALANDGRKEVRVSPRGLYQLAKKYDEFPGEDYEGTSLSGALKAAKAAGVYLESDWPYAARSKPKEGAKPFMKLSGYAQVNSIPLLLSALREQKVVVAAIQVTEDFDQPPATGKVTVKLPLKPIGTKVIAIVGYDSKSADFKFANDWGSKWGAGGFGLLKDSDLSKILVDAYTVDL